MRRILCTSLILLQIVNMGFTQLSEKLNFLVSGGISIPVESSVGESFEFVQLNQYFELDFASTVLGIKQSSSNFEEYWKPGYNFGSALEYKMNNYLSLQGIFNYNHFEFDKNRLTTDFQNAFKNDEYLGLPFNTTSFVAEGGETNMYTFTLNLVGRFPLNIITPYVTAGGGYMHINQDGISVTYFDQPFEEFGATISFYDVVPKYNDDVFTANAGIGLIFNLGSNFRPYIEADYILGFTVQKADEAKGTPERSNTIVYPIKFGFLFNLK
jgi:hypothetical protein